MGSVPKIVLPGAHRIDNSGCDNRLAGAKHQLPALRRVGRSAAGIYEIRMRTIRPSIEDGHFHAARGYGRRRQVLAGQQAPRLQRLDGWKPPRGPIVDVVGRRDHRMTNAVWLNKIHLRVGGDPGRDSTLESGRNPDPEKTLVAQGVDLGAGKISGNQRIGSCPRPQVNDELVRDDRLPGLGQVLFAGSNIESGNQTQKENDRAAPHVSLRGQ